MSEEQYVTIDYKLSGTFTLQSNMPNEQIRGFISDFLMKRVPTEDTEHILRPQYRIKITYDKQTGQYTAEDNTGTKGARDHYLFRVMTKLEETGLEKITASSQQSAPSRQ